MKKLIFVLTCLLLVIPCQARMINVNWDGSGDYLTIQAAINDANDGDTIIVADGTYTGDGNRDIDFLGKAVTLRSKNGPENCVINCQHSGRGFYFHSGETAQSIVSGFTVKSGLAAVGGAIACEDSSPKILSNIIKGNEAFMEGEVPGFGGGLYFRFSSALVANNLITQNKVTGRGGGLFSDQSEQVLLNNIITGNAAHGYSGFFSSPGRGGGISCERSTIMITNNTISGNRANGISIPPYSGRGGGIQSGNSHLILANTVFWYNNPQEINSNNSTVEASYSNIEGGWAGIGNIFADPCFADPGHWDDNGTPFDSSDDFWINGDYHLKSQADRWDPNTQTWVQDDVTSPCIDAGNPGCPLSDEPNDVNNVRINMGAYGGTAEASKSPADWRSIADLTNDWVVDSNDLKAFTGYWLRTGECIPSDLNRSQSVDFNDFSIFGLQWSYPTASEPGITYYQIKDCDPNSFRSLAKEQAIETRFTVTVEGRYIHFKDIMAANCCTDKLGLEMTLEDNLITIYETEYTPGGCFCICDYPVTATLGPFEPGIYTLEVYEEWSGFIGRTNVVIEPPP